ncbi:MAG TPA: alpha/beta fold hydrolase, partial [Burkholderiaceae bacterium]|nr:alpha/beta fold hydrolase [Burkholderiaceae bacterium]
DLAGRRADAVGNERKLIDPEMVGPVSVVHYKAADGLEMDGVLTLPPGRTAKNLPVVMMPHGGPLDEEDRPEFNWWAQALASRGYAVFQPNFRGSGHRGDAFMAAGYGQWGRKMQTDISDGLAELARQGIVDPKRACIVGASYGGYAALAGVTLQQGLYRCAVAFAPVSDLFDMYTSDNRESGLSDAVQRYLDQKWGPVSGFAAVSPRKHAADADAPILIIHGKDDTTVPFSQGTRMVDALKEAKKPVEFVVLDKEDHYLSRAETRKAMLAACVRFVMQHNPPD